MRQLLRGLGLILAVFLCVSSAHAQWTWSAQTGRWVNLKKMPKETPELQIEYARSLMMDGSYKKAIRETAKFSEFYKDSELADQNQFLRGEIKQKQGDYLDSAKEFQQVVTAYPNSKLYDDVIKKQYEIGDQFYDLGVKRLKAPWWRPFKKAPFKNAIKVYTMVIDNQPFTAAAAEAQYKVGLCHYTRKEYIEAAYEYRRVVEDYGASDWVDEASYGLATCYYDASKPAEYDQAPSQLAINAIDDFVQRYPTDERGKDLVGKRKEMRDTIALQRLQTAQFYEKRRQFDAARIYYNVVVDQFSETAAADKAREWLSKSPAAQAGGVATGAGKPAASS